MLPGPCAPPLEAPSVPYQILTHFSCRLPTRRIIKSLASPLIFKRKSPRLERPAQPGTSGLRVSPAGLRTQRGEAGRRGKGAAPGDEELRAGGGGAQAPPHPMCCRSSGRRGRVTPSPQPRGAHSDKRGRQEPPAAPGRARSRGARQGGGRSILPTAPRAPLARGRRAPAGTRCPAQHVAVRVRPRARSRPVRPHSPFPAHAPPGTDAQPARTGGRGRSLGGGAGAGGHPRGRGWSPGVHLRGPRAGRRRGPGAPAAAASCAGAKTPPSRGSHAEEAAVGAAAIRPGFYSGAATGGSPDPRDAGSGSSPWRGLPSSCPETTHPPPPPRSTQEAPPPILRPLLSEERPPNPLPTPPRSTPSLVWDQGSSIARCLSHARCPDS